MCDDEWEVGEGLDELNPKTSDNLKHFVQNIQAPLNVW